MKSARLVIIPDKNRIPDIEVVERVLTGEKELYELLIRRHNQKLYRTLRSYLQVETEVEDAMQDTYLRAYENLHQFRKDALFSTWLIRIGINVALAKLRERKHLASATTIEGLQDSNLILQIPEPSLMNPEKITIQKEGKQLLEKAIDCLPEKYRTIYVLREMEDLSINEISQCLDLSESNVKVRLHRAKSMLKESLYKFSVSRDVFEFGFQRCDAMVNKVMAALP
ncbi:MAG: RNA polymerase sigma factor [Bacteroidota bacterium]|nr:RNA polymerase sigma factor [Bacteroidota bacterium]